MEDEQNPLLNFKPEPPVEGVSEGETLADLVRSKYPSTPSVGSNTQTQKPINAFDAPVMGFGGADDSHKVSFKDYKVPFSDIYKQMGDGTFQAKLPNYIAGTNNQERVAQEQTTGEKWANGLQKFGLKTGAAALGGTVGSVTGLFNAMQEGSLQALYTDDFSKMLDVYNEKLEYKLPNYYTEQERDKGFIESMGTANFWANDFLGGLSFTIGMVVSEGIWGAATGGTSLIARGAINAGKVGRWSTKVLGAEKALAGLAKYKAPVLNLINKTAKTDLAALKASTIKGATTAQALNQARFIYTSAGYEAGVEARHYMKEAEDEYVINFQQQYGRNPNAQEFAAAKEAIADGGNVVWGANLALVGSSNMAVFGKMLLGRSTKAAVSNSAISRELFGKGYTMKDGVATAIKANTRQKVAGKVSSILKPMLIEGVYEEGGQSVAAKSVKEYILSGYDIDSTKSNLSMMDSVLKGIHETYGTKEGRKEVGLGMLIGLFGGGMATGGRFNEMSQGRKNIEEAVDYRNAYTPERVLAVQMTQQRIITNNKILSATRKQKEAADRNDMTTEYLSEQQAIIASIERDSAFQGTKQGIEDFEAYLATVNNKELAEEMGMENEGEAQTWKEDKLAEYKNLSERYSQNEKYVRAIVGDQNFAGASELNTNSEQIIKAITYNMTLGEQSKEFTTKIVADIKMAIAGDISGLESFSNSVEVDAALANVSKESKGKYMKLSFKVNELNRKRQTLERQLLTEQQKPAQTSPESHATNLGKIQARILEITDEITEVSKNKEAAFRALGIENDVITQEDLDSQADNVKALGEKMEGYKNTNPQLYGTLNKLFEEYGKAKTNTTSFNKMTQELLDPTIRVDVISGWLSGILKKGKTLDESTKEFFKEQLDNYETNQVQGKVGSDVALNDRIQTDQKEEEEKVEETKGDEMENPEVTTAKPEAKSPLQVLKQKIADIMGKNDYTTSYIGNDFDEAVKSKPSEQDVNRYEELVNKVNSKYITRFSELLAAPKGWFKSNKMETGLTVEEIEELKDLQNKLSNWKVLEGSSEGDISVAELILLAEQLETEVEKSNTKTDITEEEYGTIKQSSDRESKDDKFETAEGVQSPDQVLVSEIDINGEPTYTFSHLAVESLTKLFPESTLELVQGKVSNPIENVDKNELADLSKKEGTVFLLRTPDGDIKVTVGRRSRLNISKKSLEKSLESSNIAIVKYGSGTFRDIYEKLENGDMIPLRGDFRYASEIEGEHIELLPDVVNNVTEGQILITRINKNDSYNKMLLKKYNKSKKTEEDLNELMNDLHVYITDQTGQMVGSLRATSRDLPDTDATKNLLELRRKAVDMFLDKANEGLFSLNESMPVKTVLVGSPNFVIEDGKPKAIDFTDTALEQVEDVGYFEGDTLNLNKMDSGKVVKTFLPKTSSKKMPVVILKVNGKSVAFPVTLKSTELDRTEEVREILSTDLSEGDKVSRINAILIESGLKPADYAITKGESVYINEEKVLNDLSTIKSFPNLAEWVKPNYKLEALKEEAQIGIDMDNNPFNLSKVMLDLSKTKTLGRAEQIRDKYNSIEAQEIKLRAAIQSAVKPILDGQNLYPNVDNVRWTDALFYEGELDRNPIADVDKRKNINTLRDALYKDGKRVAPPKAVREAYGEEFIENLRKNIEELDRLTEAKKTKRSEIKNAKLKKETESQKENC